MTNFVLLRSTVVFLFFVVIVEAIGVEAEVIDEIATSTSLAKMHNCSFESEKTNSPSVNTLFLKFCIPIYLGITDNNCGKQV